MLTDGEQRASLALVRSLGQAGYTVHVCSMNGRSLAGASRYAQQDHPVPDALGSPRLFSDRIGGLCRELGIGLLIPVSEGALLALLSSPLADKGIIPFPDLDHVLAVCDKERVLKAASEAGIAVPAQHVLINMQGSGTLDVHSLRYPLVIKPARSINTDGNSRVKFVVKHAASPSELTDALGSIPSTAYPLLLQQRIVGPGIGIFLLLWNNQVVAQFAHRRIREKPPAGGVSVYRESVGIDQDLVLRSRLLLERFAWNGVAMVEYKVDESTGTPYLMEINGRFWGSLQLAVDSGVDFPVLLAQVAAGNHPAPVLTYRTGVRSRWWWGDVDHLLARVTKSPEALGLPYGAPSRWRVLADFLKLWRPGDHNEIWRWRDPAPSIRESLEWLKRR
ncbi:MAG: ATP-grasp domain-containing protein [Gemmatimonadota bacterium]